MVVNGLRMRAAFTGCRSRHGLSPAPCLDHVLTVPSHCQFSGCRGRSPRAMRPQLYSSTSAASPQAADHVKGVDQRLGDTHRGEPRGVRDAVVVMRAQARVSGPGDAVEQLGVRAQRSEQPQRRGAGVQRQLSAQVAAPSNEGPMSRRSTCRQASLTPIGVTGSPTAIAISPDGTAAYVGAAAGSGRPGRNGPQRNSSAHATGQGPPSGQPPPAPSLPVFTDRNDQAVALPRPAPPCPRSRATAGVLRDVESCASTTDMLTLNGRKHA